MMLMMKVLMMMMLMKALMMKVLMLMMKALMMLMLMMKALMMMLMMKAVMMMMMIHGIKLGSDSTQKKCPVGLLFHSRPERLKLEMSFISYIFISLSFFASCATSVNCSATVL